MAPVRQADNEKVLGTEAFKRGELDVALKHYEKAIELDPTQILYYWNKAAVLLKKNECVECVRVCLEGIDVGRENNADGASLAKVYTRIADAYSKQDNSKDAMKYYKKSLQSQEDVVVRQKLVEIEKLFAPVNPKKDEKDVADEHYRNENYIEALKCYSDLIKKDPKNAQLYGNRAQCYFKLNEFRLAISESDESTKLDPNYVKGYIRKGFAYLELKEFSKAMMAFENVLKIDEKHKDALEGHKTASVGFYANPAEIRKRALEDPEIREILSEPDMRTILEEMILDSKQAPKYLKSSTYSSKLEKLTNAGILRFC